MVGTRMAVMDAMIKGVVFGGCMLMLTMDCGY